MPQTVRKQNAARRAQIGAPSLPVPNREHYVALLNQQCWCWGQDVQRVEGNALLCYGFMRDRAPAGTRGGSMYTLHCPCGRTLVLWGFGFWYGDAAIGGVYVNRFQFDPQWTAVSNLTQPIWRVDQLPLAPMGKSEWMRCHRLLLPNALYCIADYERWVISTLGVEYRQQCVDAFYKPVLPAAAIADAWEELARYLLTDEEMALEMEGWSDLPDPFPMWEAAS